MSFILSGCIKHHHIKGYFKLYNVNNIIIYCIITVDHALDRFGQQLNIFCTSRLFNITWLILFLNCSFQQALHLKWKLNVHKSHTGNFILLFLVVFFVIKWYAHECLHSKIFLNSVWHFCCILTVLSPILSRIFWDWSWFVGLYMSIPCIPLLIRPSVPPSLLL